MSLYIPFGFMQENATPFCTNTIEIFDANEPRFDGQYNRIYNYTGGTFLGGYLQHTSTPDGNFVTGIMPETNTLNAVYERIAVENGGTVYYNLMMRDTFGAINFSWGIIRTLINSKVNGASYTASQRVNNFGFLGKDIGSVYIPLSGSTLTGMTSRPYVYYYDVCPSPTPTPTNTKTPTPTPTGTPTPTPTPTGTPEPPPAYNYYTFTPCVGGAGTDYRSILSLALNDVYAFQASPPARNCYEITSITASVNSNDLPTIYGPKTDCSDSDCTQP